MLFINPQSCFFLSRLSSAADKQVLVSNRSRTSQLVIIFQTFAGSGTPQWGRPNLSFNKVKKAQKSVFTSNVKLKSI